MDDVYFTEEQSRSIIANSFKNDGYFKLNICLFNFLNKNWEATGMLTELMNKEEYFIKEGKIEKDSDFYLTQAYIEQRLGLSPFKQNQALDLLKDKGLVSVERKGLPARNYYKLNSSKILMVLSASPKVPLELDPDGLNRYNNNRINNNLIINSPNGELNDSCESSQQPIIIKRRNKPLPAKDKPPIRNLYSKESLSPPAPKPNKSQKPLSVPEEAQSIIDYWIEHKLHFPRIGTKSYRNCVIHLKDLLAGKLFSQNKYSADQIKKAIDNFSAAAFDPECDPLSPDKKKKLQHITIGDFIISFQGYSYFKDYLTRKPSATTKDKNPEVTKAIKKLYSEDIFGTAHKEFDQKDENFFRQAADRLKKFLQENNARWNSMMVPASDYEEARLLWDSIKYDLGTDYNLAKIKPSWLVSNTTFDHRLPAYLFHQGYLMEDESVSRKRTSLSVSKQHSNSNEDLDYYQNLLYDN